VNDKLKLWEPKWVDERCEVPFTVGEAHAAYALIGEWIKHKQAEDPDRDAIRALPGHRAGDVESVILKLGAVLRSMGGSDVIPKKH
jgi:hypothetical protein